MLESNQLQSLVHETNPAVRMSGIVSYLFRSMLQILHATAFGLKTYFFVAKPTDRSSQLLSAASMAALSLAYYDVKQDCHQLSIVKDQIQLAAVDNNYIKFFLSCKLYYSLLRNKNFCYVKQKFLTYLLSCPTSASQDTIAFIGWLEAIQLSCYYGFKSFH